MEEEGAEQAIFRGDMWFRRAGELLEELQQAKLQHAEQQHALTEQQHALTAAQEKAASACDALERRAREERDGVVRAEAAAAEVVMLREATRDAQQARDRAEARLKMEVALREEAEAREERLRATAREQRGALEEAEAATRRERALRGEADARSRSLLDQHRLTMMRAEAEAHPRTPYSGNET
eukprot:1746493-Prymnesium_polylepis.1